MSLKTSIEHVSKNWKTTLAGFLNTIVALSAAGAFAPNPVINTKVSGYLCAVATMSNLTLHVFMRDGQLTNLTLPANSSMQMNVPAGSTVNQTTSIATPEAKS